MALAAVPNPLDKKEALVFGVSARDDLANLSLARHLLDSDPVYPYPDNNVNNSDISVPGDLGIAPRGNITNVYGITKFKDKTADDVVAVITLLSPVITPIDDASKDHARPGAYTVLAAAGDSEKDHVFFLQNRKGSNVPQIIHYILSTGSPQRSEFDDPVDTNSKLAAISSRDNDTDPWVFFRGPDDTSIQVRYIGSKRTETIPETADCHGDSHLSIIGNNGVRYLYYMNTNRQLSAVAWSSGQWTRKDVTSSDKVDQVSGIAAVPGDGANHIFYYSEQSIIRVDDGL